MPTAMVTGATSGIGRAFAMRLARDGYQLTLVARDLARLQRVAGELGGAEVIAADLSTAVGQSAVAERLRTEPVDLLVNNAGHGAGQPFIGGEPAVEEAMFEVNAHAVLRLTRAVLPGMVERRSGQIVNVSSVAAWVPRGSYSATKAYVLSLSRSLAIEAAPYGITVQALCPGLTHTEFHARSGSDAEQRSPGWLWLSAERVVEESLAALARGRTVCLPGRRWRVLMALTRLVPTRVSVWFARRGHGEQAQPRG